MIASGRSDSEKVHELHPWTDVLSRNLYRMHGVLTVAHLVTSLLMFALVATQFGDAGKVQLFDTYASRKSSVPEIIRLGVFQVGYLCAAFLLMAATDHAVVLLCRTSHTNYLRNGENPYRWAEYAVSLSTMNVLIMVLCGVLELGTLLLGVLLSMTCIACGWLHESVGMGPDMGRVGWIPYVTYWILVFVNVSRADSLPSFVWVIIIILFVLQTAFGVVPWMFKAHPYIYTEFAFCALSAVSKQLLAWITFFGVLSMK